MIEELQPELVTMENVPQLMGHRVFKRFLKSLGGYHLWHGVVNCAEYGVPQSRKRLVLLASRLGPVQLIEPTHAERALNVRDAIAQLPPIPAGGSHPDDPLHVACNLSEVNLRRIKASRPGGTWRDWPSELLAECHVKESGKTYPSVYGRMHWEMPSPTITTQCFGFGNGRFGHPEQDRAISLREAALIQTFPSNYRFVPNGHTIKFSTLGRLIGNAVPVRVGEIVAKSLVCHVAEVS
jgi:DNA (cytosine-5)-methyltransferase 1